jgi:hypothetical protein
MLLVLGGLMAVGLCAAGWVWATWPVPPPPTDWSDDYNTTPQPAEPASYDLTARPADPIAPGTVVGTTAPKGWSHLVIKSLPRVRPDQRPGLSQLVVEKAGWMFTAFVADVVPNGGRFRLRAVGLGLGASMNGKDTILTPETVGRFELIGKEILSKGYEVQRKAVVVVRGPSLALLDTPVWFRCGDGNRLVRYRYALLADTATGRLDTLVWRLGGENEVCSDLSRAVWLAPDTIDPAELVVDRAKVNRFGVPADDAFAVEKMPAGRATLTLPPDLRPLAAQIRFTAADARALDTRLRTVIAEASPRP